MFDLINLGKRAKSASFNLIKASEEKIDKTLIYIAELLKENADKIIDANLIDVENAKSQNKSEGFIDRLTVTEKVIDGIREGLIKLSELESGVGASVYNYENLEQGIKIEKRAVPFGVVGMIYEARPFVTVDAFSLCFKTKNAVILRGGSDAINTNKVIVELIKQGLKDNGIDQDAVNLLEDTSRETAERFMKLNEYIDLLIPRGGAGLIKSAVENSTIPIIETGTGNCHVYIDEFADKDKAVKVIFNAKTQRYSVCNATESLVFHKKSLNVLPEIYGKLFEKKVKFYCDEESYSLIKDEENVFYAKEEDFYTEYGDACISVKTVESIEQAVSHINQCSTKHSESIITENKDNAEYFMENVDSSCVYHNASTRFSDGFVFGLGAEIGISTQKLHARGPMGLSALLTTKYFVFDQTEKGAIRK